MFPSVRPTQKIAALAAISPISLTAGTPALTAYIKADQFYNYLALVQTGVLGTSATINAKLVQATDAAGTGVKDVPGKALAQIVESSGDNKQAFINLRPDELDIASNYKYFALSVTAGTANSLASAVLLGFDGRQQPPSGASSVVEAVI